ncbi:hypothetical protein ACXR2U_04305 [Jatrophihabitans sp. YIM 134969]
MPRDRVEFVDAEPGSAGGSVDDVLDVGRPDAPHGRRPAGRAPLVAVGAAVVVLVAAVLVGRAVGGSPTPTASPSASPSVSGRGSPLPPAPVVGLVGLPRAIGTPRELVASASGDDIVWMLDRGAGIVRIQNGQVTAVQLLESQASAIAVSPLGDRLYVATAVGRPAVQVFDATTLEPGRSRAIEGSIAAMVVSTDAVWAASGSRLLRLDLDSLDTLSTVDMPGVITTDHLRMQVEQTSSDEPYVVGLVTGTAGSDAVVSRFVRVDPATEQARFGPPIPHVTDVATARFLTWVTTSDDPPVTEGFASVLDRSPETSIRPPLAPGTRIYDGGSGFAAILSVAPDSSVVTCRDPGGFASSEIDVGPALPDATITGQVLRTSSAFYVVTDRGLVRQGVGDCR